ncbi:MAG: hypothetical protein ABMA64_30325 [Myxococcota bacterium]
MRPVLSLVAVTLLAACADPSAVDSGDAAALAQVGIVGPPDAYAVDFIATAAGGIVRNDAGDVVGDSYPDPGCGPFCLPPLETVVWRSTGERLLLPSVAGFSGIYPTGIDPAGMVVGYAGPYGTNTGAAVWQFDGVGYSSTSLGTLPGTTASYAVGVDDTGRVVGWSTTLAIPPVAAPFLWTEAGGLVDLTTLGFPNELPLSVSPGGVVTTPTGSYDLDDPTSFAALTAPPAGYLVGTYPTLANDAGEQARFLVANSGSNLVYPYRYHPDGTWVQLSSIGTGNLSSYGLGGIDADGTVTGTVLGGGMIGFGVDGLFESIDPLLSPAYDATLAGMGSSASDGSVLGSLFLGTASRLVTLVPVTACTAGCAKVSTLTMTAKFVQDPAKPGQCTKKGKMKNSAKVTATVTDEAGVAIAGATVSGRFLDSYWMDAEVTGVTDATGKVTFSKTGKCGTGTWSFLVDDAVAAGRVFDRTTGVLSVSKIPL